MHVLQALVFDTKYCQFKPLEAGVTMNFSPYLMCKNPETFQDECPRVIGYTYGEHLWQNSRTIFRVTTPVGSLCIVVFQ